MGQSSSKSSKKPITEAKAALVVEAMVPPEQQLVLKGMAAPVLQTVVGDLLDLKDKASLAQTSKSHYFLFKPQITATKLLRHVAFGEQELAENMVRNDPGLLLAPSPVTDYSGRRFPKVRAYELAWWYMDTHMCRMLESHMDNGIRSEMLKCVDAIEQHGLRYEQRGVVVEHSKHFDFSPLKRALEDYIQGYANWDASGNIQEMTSAWMRVGREQSGLPAHALNEYLRPDRSFFPTPAFDEKTLPRTLMFYNYNTIANEALFSPGGRDGLGVDFALARGRGYGVTYDPLRSPGTSARGGGGRRGGIVAVRTDLAAVSRLDEVRTADLTQSRENLGLIEPEHAHGAGLS